MKSLAAIVLVILISHTVATPADEFSVANNSTLSALTQLMEAQRAGGTVRMNYFRSSKSLDNDTDFLGATVQVKALPGFTDAIDGKLEARVTNPSPGDGGETQSRLLEAYVTTHFAKADLRLGKQIVAWGRADGINPTDNLTPRDYVVLLPFEDDQRTGTVAIKLDVYLSPQHTFTVFTTPFFEPSDVPLPTAALLIEETPAHTLSDSEIGFKLDKVDENFDWSVSFFHGFSLLPNLRVLNRDAAEPLLESHYDRVNVLGADFARNFGRFGFRGEMAYVDTADNAGTDSSIRNSDLFWIMGIDRTFFENLNVNLQFFQRRIRHYHNPEDITDSIERAIAIQNAIITGQQDRINNGISFRFSNKWFNDTLEAEIFAVVNVTRRDHFLRPLMTYAFNDHWKGTFGAELYHGSAQTPFGSLKPNRGVFVELRYGF